ncbi:UNVERIFIED_CONTAM: hypothetical protein K0B97_08945, partial [Spiribacter pallidus]
DDDLGANDFGDLSDVATTFNTTNAGTPQNATAGQEVVFTVGNDDDDETGVYFFQDADGNGDINAGDSIALLGVLDTDVANVTSTEFSFA